MISATVARRACVAIAALTLACGDSTGPNANLSEAQVADMLQAIALVAPFDDVPTGGTTAFRALRASPSTANATISVSETVDCPNGGSASVDGIVNSDEEAGTLNAQVTHDFDGCAATSEQGRVWTFNGNPSIVTTLGATSNEETGAFSITTTQVGGIAFSSDLGTGTCQINLTFSLSRTGNTISGSFSGSACGRNFQQAVEVTP